MEENIIITLIILYSIIIQICVNIYCCYYINELKKEIKDMKEERNRLLELWKK